MTKCNLAAILPAMSRYIVLFVNTFRARDWHRLGCHAFAEAGYDVLPVQTVATAEKDSAFPVSSVTATDTAALEAAIGRINRSDIVLNLTPISTSNLFVYRWLAENKVPYAVMTRGGIPFSFRGMRAALSFGDFARLHGGNVLHLASRVKHRAALLSQNKWLTAPRWWIRSGTTPVPKIGAPFPWLYRAEPLPMLSFDAQEHFSSPADPTPAEPYAVFLDQMLTCHPDFKHLSIPFRLDAGRYFNGMRAMFQRVETQLGLPVRIALHPKADKGYAKNYGRPAIGASAAAAVRGCSLVLCHATTAASFAVLNRVPVLSLTSDDLEKTHIGAGAARLSGWLGQRRVNIDHAPNIQTPLVDEARYAAFSAAFLGSQNGSLGWPEVVQKISGCHR